MFDVTTAGDINMDLILYGLPEEMPLERELLASGFQSTLGGSAAIFAHNLSTLGLRVGFVGMTGRDELGRIAVERLQHAGTDTSRCVESSSGTRTAVTLLLPHGRGRRILTYPGTIAELTVDDLDINYLADSSHFHISSYFLLKGLQPGLPDLCHILKDKGLSISLDTNDDPDDRWGSDLQTLLTHIDVLLPNEHEAKRMAGTDDLPRAILWLADRVPTVVVKCGARGALVSDHGNQFEIPSIPAQPVDTIGAGDSFDAGFISKFITGAPASECAAMGNKVAAHSTLGAGGTEAFRNHSFTLRSL